MRKKFFYGIAVLAIAAVAAWNVNLNSKSAQLSDVSLANVEALADDESGTGARSCSTSWKISILGVSVEKSCSVTCDIGFNAVCGNKNASV